MGRSSEQSERTRRIGYHARPMEAPWARAAATPGGYVWWYVDALSPSGDGLVCIFFAGSVFSPDYAARLGRGERALPGEHAAVNLALYRGGRRVAWVMSEYGSLVATEARVAVGRSELWRDGGAFRIRLHERSAPLRLPVEGSIEAEPEAGAMAPGIISAAGGGATHGWQVLAPRARVRARFRRPAFALDGVGYVDRNWGDGRLEDAFARWSWARFHGPRRTTIVYALVDRDGRRRAFSAEAAAGDEGGAPVEETPAPEGGTRRAAWGLTLPLGFGAGAPERLRVAPDELLEQAPFYARYRARLVERGLPVEALGMGEHLDLDRFRSPFIRFLLRYKMRHA
jgi:carotenoid 1,2-hydratase